MLKEHINLSNNFEVLYWISYDINRISNNDSIFNEITNDMINNVDGIWITREANKVNKEVFICEIEKFILNKKIVYISSKLDYEKQNLIDEKFGEKCEYIKYKNDIQKEINLVCENSIENFKSSILNIDTPIITVMGMLPNIQKFDIQLYLRKYFLDAGYNVLQIGSNTDCELLGFYSMPDFMYDSNFNETTKILKFNRFVQILERVHKPDIIIIGIPNAILPYSKNSNFNFGIEAYEILNAIQSDYNILSLPNGEYNDDYYKDIENLCKYRYNTSLDSIFISQFVPISNTTESLEFIFAKTEERVNKSNIMPIYNIKSLENGKFFNYIISILEEYSEIELF